jgi:hypothetical protein
MSYHNKTNKLLHTITNSRGQEFHVGTIVHVHWQTWAATLGEVVKIEQRWFDTQPSILVHWFTNGREGLHDPDNLVPYCI